MNKYRFVAKDLSAKYVKGEIEARSNEEAYSALRQKDLFCVKLELRSSTDAISQRYRMNLSDLALFCRQLSIMISSGMTIIRAIDILYKRAEKRKMKASYLVLYEDIQKGVPLSEAMRSQGNAYPMLLINMVHAGEESGSTDVVMIKMAEYYEKENKNVNKIKSALAYPAFLLGVTLVVMIGLFVFVLPNFFTLFDGAEVPALTRAIMDLSNFFIYKWYVGVLFVAICIFATILALRFESVKLILDKSKLNVWLFGKINATMSTSRFTNTLAILYSSGIAIMDAVDISVRVLNNRYISKAFEVVYVDIRKGEMLSTAISKTGVFDTMLTSMIFMGEESGSLDKVLLNISGYYENRAQNAIDRMMALMEPIMMVILAIIVGTIVASVFLPMYDMYGTII